MKQANCELMVSAIRALRQSPAHYHLARRLEVEFCSDIVNGYRAQPPTDAWHRLTLVLMNGIVRGRPGDGLQMDRDTNFRINMDEPKGVADVKS